MIFDPIQGRFSFSDRTLSAEPVAWPAGLEPSNTHPQAADSSPLPKADALVVTWTSGEATTMGRLFAGADLEDWLPYRHNVTQFLPKVTGAQAPFNAKSSGERTYHTLGLYTTVVLGGRRVLVVKSGLHPAYDGPAMPVVDLWNQMIDESAPHLVVTTGTAGGIGAETQLGDVSIASMARFDCKGPFKQAPFAKAMYSCSPINEGDVAQLATGDLLAVNGKKLPTARTPKIWMPSDALSAIVTTDTFAYDDTADSDELQGLGRCCDMEDATLGLALSRRPGGVSRPAWTSIRNASDPQVAGSGRAARKKAEDLYGQYQDVTTAGSVIATWATIVAMLGNVSGRS